MLSIQVTAVAAFFLVFFLGAVVAVIKLTERESKKG